MTAIAQSDKKTNVKSVFHDFYKTKMCPVIATVDILSSSVILSQGPCRRGRDCKYAHSELELREPPNLLKTKLCPDYGKGMCQLGDKCRFAHGFDELRSTPDVYKTALCFAWKNGKCKAGERCRFAHGEEELRPAYTSCPETH
eukprot:TRINITY_DN15691_c0_g1_i1.p1 TRINITY_DN15691_c0_g1~~TRINITY_DN15691_c0_g1_i1.p1  ORF type:complete len:143 (+),score=21.35 TRINITY_DN15691_c0_g1_i1:229-657(+)